MNAPSPKLKLADKPQWQFSTPPLCDELIPAAQQIITLQEEDGAIPWYDDGPWDSWNHTEGAMALAVMGEMEAANKAFECLKTRQEDNGSWQCEYGNTVPMADEVTMARKSDGVQTGDKYHDTNMAAYPAVGLWHHYQLNGDIDFVREYWPVIKKGVQFVLSLQRPKGDILWASEALQGEADDNTLRAGNASIYKSLYCAIELAKLMGEPYDAWAEARERLGTALRNHPALFDRDGEDRLKYAMDWYYPVLGGVLTGEAGHDHLIRRWDEFIEDGEGCRCVTTEPWATIAEGCELVMALLLVGDRPRGEQLFLDQLKHHDGEGVFWMGRQFAHDAFWPMEKPSWTQAALILAADALYDWTPASKVLIEA